MANYVRVDVWNLAQDDPIITAYAGAVAAMQAKPASDPTSWAYQAAIHGSYAPQPLPQWNQCRHGSWYFTSWHRGFLYYFERVVRAQVIANGGAQDWALPYWNYDGGGDHNQLPLAFRQAFNADGTDNPLYVKDRDSRINAGAGLPSEITSPDFALSRPIFIGASEFGGGVTSAMGQFWSETGRLEQTPHNVVHSAIGGLMGDPDTAAEDPIFWLHHANIDRVWWQWQQQHSDPSDPTWSQQPFEFADADGTLVSITGADVEDTDSQLDYTYDQVIAQAPAPALRPRVSWPSPWPPRVTADAGQGGEAAGGEQAGAEAARARAAVPLPGPSGGRTGVPLRHLVGATDRSVNLTGEPTTVPVTIDQQVTGALSAEAVSSRHEHRAFLDIEDIEADHDPGTVYGVYVNLPSDPSPAELATHHVGNVSLFGVARARNPRGDEHAHSLRVSMEITDLLDQLAADGSWQDGQQLDVSFRPLALEAPAATPELVAQVRDTAHSDVPITIGRVSIRFA